MAPLVVLLAFLAVADAQSVYKCQGPDGRVTYQNTPCAGQSTGDAMSSSRLTGNTVAAPKSPPPADAAPDAAASRAGKCYEDSDLREISVRMSSPSLSQ